MTLPSVAMKHLASIAALALFATSAALAQSSAQAPPADPQPPTAAPPVFRTGSELVRVDVRVTDDQGHPVTDLRPGEVKLEEEGKPRPVVLFQHIAAPLGTYTEAAQRTIGAEVSTNQGAPQGHIYVLVFDEVHIRSGHEQRARLAAERFLRTNVRPGDRVALYALPGPGPQIPFTADVGRVLHELPAIRGSAEETGGGVLASVNPMGTFEAYEITRGNQVILDRETNQASQNLQATDTRNSNLNKSAAAAQLDDPSEIRQVIVEDAKTIVTRADADSRRFLVSFADVIRTLRSADGRKAVILFSEGFQTDNVTRELGDVAAAAAQSYSVVYALDLNPRTLEMSDNTPRGGEQLRETQDKLQSLGSLTGETAGTLVLDAPSQMDQALARIADTSEDYYLLGFTPANPDDSDRNRYRHVHVSVSRPGTHVSARTGYVLEPKGTPADRRRTIDAALQAPFGQKGLAVEYTTYTLRGSSSAVQRVIMCLSADLPVASASTKSADVVYIVRDTTTGKVVASGSDQLPLPEAANAGNPNVFRVQFEVPAGTYLMRALVREPGGLVGSADRRFQVRALNGPDVTASDLVVGSSDVKGLPVRASAYASDLMAGVFEVYGRTEAELEGLKISAELGTCRRRRGGGVRTGAASADANGRQRVQPRRAGRVAALGCGGGSVPGPRLRASGRRDRGGAAARRDGEAGSPSGRRIELDDDGAGRLRAAAAAQGGSHPSFAREHSGSGEDAGSSRCREGGHRRQLGCGHHGHRCGRCRA